MTSFRPHYQLPLPVKKAITEAKLGQRQWKRCSKQYFFSLQIPSEVLFRSLRCSVSGQTNSTGFVSADLVAISCTLNFFAVDFPNSLCIFFLQFFILSSSIFSRFFIFKKFWGSTGPVRKINFWGL